MNHNNIQIQIYKLENNYLDQCLNTNTSYYNTFIRIYVDVPS